MNYKIDFNKIEEGLKNHQSGNNISIFPFTTKASKSVEEFSGVIGEFSRIMSNKLEPSKKKINNKVETVVDNLFINIENEFNQNTEEERQALKNIISTMFIEQGNLINFDVNILNYIQSNTQDKKVARFLTSVLLDEDLKGKIENLYTEKSTNIMYKLILKNLEVLKSGKQNDVYYKSNFNISKKYFTRDLEFLSRYPELYNTSLKRFLEYYYFFYITQVGMNLSEFEKADLDKVKPVYFTINTEKSVSKNRKTYDYGFRMINKLCANIFSHAVVLEFLNSIENSETKFNYKELFEEYSTISHVDDLKKIIFKYKERWSDTDWSELKINSRDSGNESFNLVYELFDSVDYQFTLKTSTRSARYRDYSNWITRFMQVSFGKTRGPAGYILTLSEDDIIFFTKLVMRDEEKIKLNNVFKEFEERGIFFDKDTRNCVIGLYEKLNIIEKKSDSGDAMYVKTIL
ncbi:MAG: DNA phosphorothioation-dependent restriction protein DptG [Sarcina sp.]